MKLIILEGCDGAGTSSHADALAQALSHQGYVAQPFHHRPHPHGASDWVRSLHYAAERAKYVEAHYHRQVAVIADRWYQSTDVIAQTVTDAAVKARMLSLCSVEEATLPIPHLTVVLDAPDEVLDERLRARGERVTDTDRVLRSLYREWLTCDTLVDTSGDVEVARSKLFDLASFVLR